MKLSIARKANFLTISMVLLSSTLLGVYFVVQEQRALETELQERSAVIAGSLAANLEYPLLIGDTAAIARSVRSTLNQKDVLGCRVEDRNGRIIYEDGTGSAPEGVRMVRQDVYVKKAGSSMDEGMILGEQKVIKEVIGRIGLTLSLAAQHQKQKDIMKAVVAVLVATIALASLATFFLFRYFISSPIGKLLEGTERIAKGDLSHEVKVTTGDELGLLANSFNAMVHELKRSHGELAQYSRTLEERVIDRTRDLKGAYDKLRATEEQLIQSAKLASLGVLAGGVAHEINNPLTGVLGYSQLLLATISENDPHRADLEEIERSAMRCKCIIDNLLRFSRQQKFAFEIVDVDQVIEDTLVLIGNQLQRNNVRIIKDIVPGEPAIRGNSQQLQQVFINIIHNAFDAMPDGGELSIATRVGTDRVEVSFRDTGTGIPADIIDKIFDPFVTTKPPGKGTGLGLSVSYGIVQKHDGEIRVENAPECGSIFTVSIPLVAERREKEA